MINIHLVVILELAREQVAARIDKQIVRAEATQRVRAHVGVVPPRASHRLGVVAGRVAIGAHQRVEHCALRRERLRAQQRRGGNGTRKKMEIRSSKDEGD